MLSEDQTTEFKREYVEDIKKTIIAFANSNGGALYIGMNDDGTVRGIEDTDAVMLQVTNAMRDAVKPDISMFTQCQVENIEEKAVLVVRVQRGTARPYYLAGKGIRPEGVFVRQGASTVPATEAAILHMIRETSGDCYEDARSLNQQLTFSDMRSAFVRKDIPFAEAQQRTLGLIGEDGTYTNLALLLSDQCPHTIKLAIFEGSIKTIFKDRKELSGSLLTQLEAAYAYIDQYNRTRAEFKGLERIDMRDYPTEAVREALLNALVHRDYAFSGSTLISIFDDRIEFVTIGGLVKGISQNDIMLGVSVLRNRNLANVFYRLKLIEAYGTGIQKILNSYAGYGVKPKIETSDNAFKIILPNTNFAKVQTGQTYEAVTNREEKVLQLLENREFIVRKDVQQALKISQATAILLLRDMAEKGLLEKEGGGKYLRYRLRR